MFKHERVHVCLYEETVPGLNSREQHTNKHERAHTLRLIAAAATECNVKSLHSRAEAPCSASVSQRRSSATLRLIAAAATECNVCNVKSLGKREPTSSRRNLHVSVYACAVCVSVCVRARVCVIGNRGDWEQR